MSRYVNMVEDNMGDLVDIEVYCSAQCFREGTGQDAYGHAWPCPEMTNYRQHCPTCETVTVAALDEDSSDSWPA